MKKQIAKSIGAFLLGSAAGYAVCLFKNHRLPLLQWYKGREELLEITAHHNLSHSF